MGKNFSVSIKVAGVFIRFTSDLDIDICHLKMLFKHHVIETADDTLPCHEVNIVGTTERVIPSDARLVWKGYYHAVGHRGDHGSDVKKYVSADGSTEYFESRGGECIVNDLAAGKTTCHMVLKQKRLSKANIRSNIDAIVMLLTHVIMAYHRRYTLHASAVVWRGRAVVFTGRSGQGKSTLCTDLVAQGAGFLGDDIVFLYMDDGQPRVASLLFDAKLFESSKTDKDFVDILKRYDCEKIDSAPLQAIAEIEQTKDGPSAVKVNSNEERLLDVLLTSANNIALQYDHNDWLSLCTCIMQEYRLHTFCFGDRKLLNKQVLDSFFDSQA